MLLGAGQETDRFYMNHKILDTWPIKVRGSCTYWWYLLLQVVAEIVVISSGLVWWRMQPCHLLWDFSYQILSYVVLGEIASSYKVIVVRFPCTEIVLALETSFCFNIIFECILFLLLSLYLIYTVKMVATSVGGGTFILHATRSPFNLQDSYQVRTGLQLDWCMVSYVLLYSQLDSISSKRDYGCVPSERVHWNYCDQYTFDANGECSNQTLNLLLKF